MKNIFTNVLKKELTLIITKDNLNTTLKQLSDFITTFYWRKKIVGYIAIILTIIALPFYKFTSKIIPNIMQKTFPNDLAFIVYCGILLLIVGIPLIIWYNMDTDYKKSKLNTLEVLCFSVQNYFDNGASELQFTSNFKIKTTKLKNTDIKEYIKLKAELNEADYETSRAESTGIVPNQNSYQPGVLRSGKSTRYTIYLITNSKLKKSNYQKKENIEAYQNISIAFSETPENYCYNFFTSYKVETKTPAFSSKAIVKNYFDYVYLTVLLLKS